MSARVCTTVGLLRQLLNTVFARHGADCLASLQDGADDELTRFVRNELINVHAQISQSSTLQKKAAVRVSDLGASSGSSRSGGVRVVVANEQLLDIEVDPGLFTGPTRRLIDEINEALSHVWSKDASVTEIQMQQFRELATAEDLADDIRAVTASISERAFR